MEPIPASARTIGVLTAAAGLVGVARPGSVSRLAAGPQHAPPAWIVRVLGARYLLQGAAELRSPKRAVLLAACAADTLHAASMVVAAVSLRAYRRAALASCAIASASALATAVTATRTSPDSCRPCAPVLLRSGSFRAGTFASHPSGRAPIVEHPTRN